MAERLLRSGWSEATAQKTLEPVQTVVVRALASVQIPVLAVEQASALALVLRSSRPVRQMPIAVVVQASEERARFAVAWAGVAVAAADLGGSA